MIKILLSGCSGKMGETISSLVKETNDMIIVAGFDIVNKNPGYPIFSDLSKCNTEIDVIIDFSNPDAFAPVLDFATINKIPIVIATTGLSSDQRERINEESQTSPVFFASNMSLGINLLLELVQKATKVLEKTFDIEVIEKHHNLKVDAPSGTAMTIAETISDSMEEKAEFIYNRQPVRKKRDKNEIGLHAIRGGTIVGEHSVIFAGTDEIIEIKHSAHSKKVFAAGAIMAAKFMYQKGPGFYSMNDVLNS
jgi:4-hydroxy-tetrahydrodipicolinate reductase